MNLQRKLGQIVLTLACLAAIVVPAAAQTGDLSAAEGDWVGAISFRSSTGGSDLPFRGGFEFVSSGGSVEGAFQWGGGATQIGGVVSGPDTMPRFDLTSVVSGGVDIPDVSGGGEIQFTAASCERLEGTGVNIDVEMMGAADVNQIVWWAVRDAAAADPTAFLEAFEALQVKVGDLLKSLEAGAVILGGGLMGQLEPLLAEAEMLASRLSRAEGCGLDFYRSVIAAEVARLVDFLLANPDVDVLTIGQVLLSALRAGVIGSGAEAGSGDVEGALRGLFAERIASARATDDIAQLEILLFIAEDIGWNDLAEDAAAALEALAP